MSMGMGINTGTHNEWALSDEREAPVLVASRVFGSAGAGLDSGLSTLGLRHFG